MLQPGEYGVYVTCPRRKEPQAAKEMKVILADAIEKYYPEAEAEEEAPASADAAAAVSEGVKEGVEVRETETEASDSAPAPASASVEDEIAKEIAELKASTRAKNQRFRQIQLNAESLLFFKVKSPIVPSRLVEQICQELLDSGEKKGRFVQRLVGIDASCSPQLDLWMALLRERIGTYLGSERDGKYMVNLTRRHFETFDREGIETHVAEVMLQHGFQHRYKDVDVVVNVYCFKNNMGVSLMRYSTFQELAKCNLQMVYDLATGSEEALGRHKPSVEPSLEPSHEA